MWFQFFIATSINYIHKLFDFILTDEFEFWLFEFLFLAIFIFALCKDRICPRHSVVSRVFRGEKSRKIIITSASAFTTFVISVIFTISSYPKNGRVLLYLINLIMITYLFFYSGWFTNKLISWWIKFEQRNFNPHGQ